MNEKIYAFLDTAQKTAAEVKRTASNVGYLAGKEAEKEDQSAGRA